MLILIQPCSMGRNALTKTSRLACISPIRMKHMNSAHRKLPHVFDEAPSIFDGAVHWVGRET